MKLTEVQQNFKSLVWDVIIKKFVADKLLLLHLPPQGIVFKIAASLTMAAVDKLYPYLVNIVEVEGIKLKNEEAQKEFEKVNGILKNISETVGTDNHVFKQAKKEAHNKLLNAVTFNIHTK